MTDQQKGKVLLVSAADNQEEINEALSALGFQVFVVQKAAAVQGHCRSHDFECIILLHPPDNPWSAIRPDTDFPENIPLLLAGGRGPATVGTPGPIIFHAEPTAEAVVAYMPLLQRIRSLFREKEDRERHVNDLEQTLRQQQQSMKQHSDFLDVLASRDGLTGLYNRRHLNKVLAREFSYHLEHGSDLSLLLLDLDFFDELNKKAGRAYGDFVLNDFAARLTSMTTPKGVCFRFSGEVFVALLPETSLAEAVTMAEKIRNSLEGKAFVRGTQRYRLTLSVGIASLMEHRPEDDDQLITFAEQALFAAKAEGRNRVAVYQPARPIPGDGSSSRQTMAHVKETVAKILDKTRKSAIESLQLLAKEIAGQENQAHIKMVRRYVELIGHQMNMPESLIRTFKNASTLQTSIRLLLHNEMIRKRQEFSSDERELMNDFPYKLLELTELFDFFAGERAILLHHAERYDGYGSPEGLKGEEIPFGARLFALVDALAAMNSDRPHRKRLSPEGVVQQLVNGAGSQFDPDLVLRTLEVMKLHHLMDVAPEMINGAIQTIQAKKSSTPS
ncbi:bifunctional diguanylate cyclase/phosphohydrolase [Desulfofustis limnaeus]|jgi:diguanylate cyclase (GGDEF)-like protein|uniref:diguanylate cyclase n=1 Tax=Desulfofustis limnaeus TaxID=2740163 RepID=A0ABM7W4A3_9BACT|nr:diguanylate cyclase [Desulfofustis limnaeus]MDX9896459.1 diguanylate cyclase [Desulfofustis sp.]BDD85738.1 hypothetical protein DPPLL_01030 [Desulfofustis limnaeus]